MQRFELLRRLSFTLAILIFILISLGGLVRNAGAGLSCPDWPLCYGKVVPPMDVRIFLEWFHRLLAGSISVMLVGISIYVVKTRELRRPFFKYCVIALGLLGCQVTLGALTVIGLLKPTWVALHLAFGMAFFGTILWMALEVGRYFQPPDSPLAGKSNGLPFLALICAIAIYIQIILGGIVSSNYAGLACPDFPTCFGSWIPPLEGLVRYQFFHRLGALTVTLAVVSFLIVGFRSQPARCLKIWMRVVAGLLIVQIALGVGSVYLKLPVLMSVAHLAVAAVLFGKMLMIVNYTWTLFRTTSS